MYCFSSLLQTGSTCVLFVATPMNWNYVCTVCGHYYEFITVYSGCGHKQYTGGVYSQFLVVATNSTCVTHEVPARVVLILLYMKGAGKNCLFLSPMRGSHPGTLLSSTSTLKESNNNSVDTNTAYSNR